MLLDAEQNASKTMINVHFLIKIGVKVNETLIYQNSDTKKIEKFDRIAFFKRETNNF